MFHFYWGGPLLFGPPQRIFLGGPDPPDPPPPPPPPGFDAPGCSITITSKKISTVRSISNSRVAETPTNNCCKLFFNEFYVSGLYTLISQKMVDIFKKSIESSFRFYWYYSLSRPEIFKQHNARESILSVPQKVL